MPGLGQVQVPELGLVLEPGLGPELELAPEPGLGPELVPALELGPRKQQLTH